MAKDGKKNGAGQAAAEAAKAPGKAPSKADIKAAVADLRQRIHSAIGQIVLALAAVPRYRHQSLADLQTLVLDPLMRDRVAIAMSKAEDASSAAPGAAGPAQEKGGPGEMGSLAGIAFWATVSDAVDAKIREQIKAGVFPIRLKPEDWTSGDKIWLLDVIAPSQKIASAVLANFRQVVDAHAGPRSADRSDGVDKSVRIHPVVAKQMDAEMLKKMDAVAAGLGASND